MAYTISNQNGPAVSRQHNIRDPRIMKTQPHIDPEGLREIWHDETLISAYKRIFGDALKEYNSKVRKSRRIKDYLKSIKENKQKNPVYEVIITVGNRDERVDDEVGKAIMKEFVDDWAKRNPHLELVGAYYHADERDPETGIRGAAHVHIDYVPVAEGLNYGLSKQNSMGKALEQQGFTSNGIKNTTLIKWEKSEREALKKICKKHGIDTVEEKRDERHHLDTEIFKKTKVLETLRNQIQTASQEVDALEIRSLTPAELNNIKETPHGKTIEINLEDYLSIKNTVADKAILDEQLAEAEKRAAKIAAEKEKLIAELESQKNNIQSLAEVTTLFRSYSNFIKKNDPYLAQRALKESQKEAEAVREKFNKLSNPEI